MTNKELFNLCKKESSGGQKLLYERYYNRMARLCFRYLSNESETFEVLTAGFLKVFRSIKNFDYRSDEAFEAWLVRIMVNECLMKLRSNKRLVMHVALDEAEDAQINDFQELDVEYLYEAIRSLPDGYREVFNMHVVEGYSHKEIAKKLEIAESSSRSQLTNAKKKLRLWISKMFEN